MRFALCCLLHHCPDRWLLKLLWSTARGDNDIGRARGCMAAFNAVVRQFRLLLSYGG